MPTDTEIRPERDSGAAHPAPAAAPALRVRGVSKTFPGQVALDGVGLELRRGEVRALLGENGSGKSTLIKILAGYHAADSGGWSAEADGRPFALGSAAAARGAGIRFIHQDLGLVPEISVLDNIALGGRYAGRRWISLRHEARHAEAALARFGIVVDVRTPLAQLTPAEQTGVAIARALRDGLDGRVLVLDEPTASLSAHEVSRLHDVIRRIRDSGGSVLYVTHRLGEVFEIADRVTVLRDGCEVADRPVAGLDHAELVRLVVGRDLNEVFAEPPEAREDIVLAAEGICGASVHDVSLCAHRGEILGVAGIAGSGREALPYLLFGAESWDAGRMTISDRSFDRMTVARALRAGVAFAPADRARRSTLPALTVRENVTLSRLPSGRAASWLSHRAERRDVGGWLERLDVRPRNSEAPLSALSGGNQQRVVLARLLRSRPKVILLEEPTRGVDMGAKAEIYRILAATAADGAAIVLFSSDAEELAAVCDRVVVLRDGRVAAELQKASLTEQAVVTHSVMEA